MRLVFLALYGGPDQIMTVTSGLASVVGLLLIFWNKVVTTFFRVVAVFHKSPASADTQTKDPNSTPADTP